MIALLVKGGHVVNAIDVVSVEAFQALVPDYCATFDHVLEGSLEPGSPGIGWTYDGSEFHPPGDP